MRMRRGYYSNSRDINPLTAPVFGINYRGYDEQEGPGTEDAGATYVFSSKDFGGVTTGRQGLLRVYSATPTGTISDILVGGVAATPIIRDTVATSRLLGMYHIPLVSGSTFDIKVALSAAGSRCAINWSTIDNTTQTTFSARDQSAGTPRASASGLFLENDPAITPPTDGILFGAAFHNNTLGDFSWTATIGTPVVTTNERAASGPMFSCADLKANGSNIVRATQSQGAAIMRYGLAAWGP